MTKDRKTVPRAEKNRLSKERQAKQKEEREAEKEKRDREARRLLRKNEHEEEGVGQTSQALAAVEEDRTGAETLMECQLLELFSESNDDVVSIEVGSPSNGDVNVERFWGQKRLQTIFDGKLTGVRVIPIKPSHGQSTTDEDEVVDFRLQQSQVKSDHFKLSAFSTSSLDDVLHEMILINKVGEPSLENLKERLSSVFKQMCNKIEEGKEHSSTVGEDEISPSELNHQHAKRSELQRKQKEKQEHERQKQCVESSDHEATIKERERKLNSKVGKGQSRGYAERDEGIVSGKNRGKYSMQG